MNVSMAQVFKAVDYANSHPDKYLNGTTNWCAAVAFDLNRQANAAPQPTALAEWAIDESAGRPILTYKRCSVIEAEDAEYVMRLVAADKCATIKRAN